MGGCVSQPVSQSASKSAVNLKSAFYQMATRGRLLNPSCFFMCSLFYRKTPDLVCDLCPFVCSALCFWMYPGTEWFKGAPGGRGRPGSAGRKGQKGSLFMFFIRNWIHMTKYICYIADILVKYTIH